MTLQISLTPEIESRLRQRAQALGQDMADIARQAVEEKLAIPETFAEILGPVHGETAQHGGIVEHELDALIEQARDEVFAARKARPLI